jgi:hypothetical protein
MLISVFWDVAKCSLVEILEDRAASIFRKEEYYKHYVSGHYPSSCFYLNHGPVFIGTISVNWAQLRRFYLKTETESSLRNVAFLNKNRTMDNVQKYNVYANVPALQTFRSYLEEHYPED